jgi:membrane carboxypeptidase/penicillin-binding protein
MAQVIGVLLHRAAQRRLPVRAIEIATGFLSPVRRAKIAADLALVDRLIVADVERPARELSAVELMTIMLEDRHFFEHSGVDPRGVLREIIRVLGGRRHGGASTIDMQFVRTATGYRANAMRRKLYEAFLAILIQTRYPKIQILRSYLAAAYFGSGLLNVNAAAQKLFGKPADGLSLEDGATVAAMLACPRPLNGPAHWYARVQRRARYALQVYRVRSGQLTGIRGRPLNYGQLSTVKDSPSK